MAGIARPRLRPIHNLAGVQARLRSGEDFMLARERGVNDISEALSCTAVEARSFALRSVLSLTEGDYGRYSIEYPKITFDEYGKVIDDDGWYIKLGVNESDVIVIGSCHPALHEITTLDGSHVPRSYRL
jgi:hypothetical protein